MAKLVLVDIKNGIGREMKFTLGEDTTPKTEWPLYVLDRVITNVMSKEQLWNMFLKNNMVPKYLQKEKLINIEFRLYDDNDRSIEVIFNNPLLTEQAAYLISNKNHIIYRDGSHYQTFIKQFITNILDYDARKYLKETYGENHFIYKFSSSYVNRNRMEEEKNKLVELHQFFEDYLNLRQFSNINSKMESYIKRCQKEREEVKQFKKKMAELSQKKTTSEKKEYEEILPSVETVIPTSELEDLTRSLCLVIDSNIKPLILVEEKSNALDDFIISNFKNSSEIREKYKDEINQYMEQNQVFLNRVRNESKRTNYRGQIVILERDNIGNFKRKEDGQYYRVSVLYSTIWKDIKTLTLNIPKMVELMKLDSYHRSNYPLFSKYESSKLKIALQKKKNNIKTPYEIERKNWIQSLKNSSHKYEQLRKLKHYLENGKLPKEFVNFTPPVIEDIRFKDVQVFEDNEEFLDEEEYNEMYNFDEPYLPKVKK